MRGVFLGVLASLLSALTALIVADSGMKGIHPLWLLLAQYLVGMFMSPPRKLPIHAPIKWHLLRLVAGLWAFGGYYAALATPGSSPSEMSLVLNIAPVLVIFFSTSHWKSRLGSVLAFMGVILVLSKDLASLSFSHAHLLALSAAGAYAGSFLLLARLAQKGETPRAINSFYNFSAGICVLGTILIGQFSLPPIWWPALAVGCVAALRIQILTIGSVNPVESGKIAVLSNLAFVWLALVECCRGTHYDSQQLFAFALVSAGVVLANAPRRDSNA